MKSEHGWLRYDSDIGWALDPGWCRIPVEQNLAFEIQLSPLDSFHQVRAHADEGALFVTLADGQVRTLCKDVMYPARINTQRLERILAEAQLLDLASSDHFDCSES